MNLNSLSLSIFKIEENEKNITNDLFNTIINPLEIEFNKNDIGKFPKIQYDYLFDDPNAFWCNKEDAHNYKILEKVFLWGDDEELVINNNEQKELKNNNINNTNFLNNFISSSPAEELFGNWNKPSNYNFTQNYNNNFNEKFKQNSPNKNEFKWETTKNVHKNYPTISRYFTDLIINDNDDSFIPPSSKIFNLQEKNLLQNKFSISNIIDPISKNYFKKQSQNKKPDINIFQQDILNYEKISYTTPNSKTTLVIKCKFCESTDHLSKDCNNYTEINSEEICLKCLSPSHETINCYLTKCLRCNKLGHKQHECPTTKEIVKCSRCRHIGHLAEDCLFNPYVIDDEILILSTCYFCKRPGHLLCPFKNEFLFIDDNEGVEDGFHEGKDKLGMSFNSDDTDPTIEKKETLVNFKKIFKEDSHSLDKVEVFCPNCAGNHFLKECGKEVRKINTRFSREENIRNQNAKSFFTTGPSLLAKNSAFCLDTDSD